MFNKYNKIVIFDTETSGLSCENNEILEFGAIVLTKDIASNKFSHRQDIDVLIKNDKPILNSHIHHITDEMCKNDGILKEEFFSVLQGLFGPYKDTLIVAYNAPFDMRFVKHFLLQMNPLYKVTNPVLDMLEVARDRTMTPYGNKLCDMIVKYNVQDVQNSHRALDDCEALLGVMRAMWYEKPDIENYVKKEK